MQDFRKLLVWRRAHALTLKIDGLVRRFPRKGATRLAGQLSGAADSIATNIVEGCGAASQREFARYLDIAIKSSSETEYHLLSARDRGFVREDEHEPSADEVVQIRRMLYGLRKKVLIDSD